MRGGSPFRTASAFVSLPVWARMVEAWGEAAWTARELFEEELQDENRHAEVRFLLGLSL